MARQEPRPPTSQFAQIQQSIGPHNPPVRVVAQTLMTDNEPAASASADCTLDTRMTRISSLLQGSPDEEN
jgi:hypothetical protein